MEEKWKPVLGFANYEVSNLGNVRHIKNGKLKIQYNQWGYGQVLLYNNGKPINVRVNRIVLIAFNYVENYKELQVNHKNYNRADNRLENLEWVTGSENCKHRNKHLKYYNSESCIDSNGRKFKSYREAARFHGIAPNTVKRDVLGMTKRVCKGRITFSSI